MNLDRVKNLRYIEPARVQALWVALVAFLITIGVSVSADANSAVTSFIAMLAVLLPIVQGEFTRARVVPVRTANSKELEALYTEVEEEVIPGHGDLTEGDIELLPGYSNE